jgi:putative pectin lyase
MPCEDLSYNEVTNAIYVKLLPTRELTNTGQYGIIFNVKLGDNTMYSTAVLIFAEVTEDAPLGYKELTMSFSLTVVDFPANVAYTGASPKISDKNTWLVYNDEQNAYIDTGIDVGYANLVSRYDEKFAEFVTPCIEATDAANAGAENANNAAATANTAAQRVEDAVDAASTATDRANTAAGTAETSATKADDAAETATASSANADAAAERANAAAGAIEAMPVVRTDTDQGLTPDARSKGRTNISTVGYLQLTATMGTQAQNWPLVLTSALADVQAAYALFIANPGRFRWSLTVTAASGGTFVEEAELEAAAIGNNIELQFTSKHNNKRYAVVLTLANGAVSAATTQYRMRVGQQKYIDQTRTNDVLRRAAFSTATGYWSLNGLTDITEDQMDLIFIDANSANVMILSRVLMGYSQARTNIPTRTQRGGFRQSVDLAFAFASSLIEVAVLAPLAGEITASGIDQFGRQAPNFVKCLDTIVDGGTSTGAVTILFDAIKATSVLFKGLKRSVNVSSCTLFETAAILYWIQNEAATTAITFTLHPDCYARVMADADIQAALVAHPLVALASA